LSTQLPNLRKTFKMQLIRQTRQTAMQSMFLFLSWFAGTIYTAFKKKAKSEGSPVLDMSIRAEAGLHL